ncbi:insecticidal toxin complex protein TcaA2 [Pseudomonas fluorescens]|uniref:Insecticidal toxin complex protein TcaA2 n=2 Tax=Pseudomonas fluorescens TaxID=294 RepID=A0AAE2U394_PSEFL|nr:insecticidal toxin complex protein TcaA2 [Pseudomonas fluorescens]
MNMQVDSSSLLAQLIDHSRPPATGRDDFKTALQRLDIHSVFDIVRLGEKAFAEQLATCNDDDAHTVYLRAQSAAAQLERLFREQQVSSDRPSRRDKRDVAAATGATYQALFKENREQFCASSSIAAVDSPVAYLRALYLFALQLEHNAKGANAVKLSDRRADLKELLIDPHSVAGQVPMLSIINRTLLRNIAGADADNAYVLLSKTWFPFSLPYHLHHQQCRLGLSGDKPMLGELNYRISRQLPLAAEANTYGQVVTHNNEVQCLLSGLSPEQQAMLKKDWPAAQDAQGFYLTCFNWTAAQGPENVTDFLHHTQLDAEQLQALLAQQTQAPRKSPYCKQDTGLTYGACYINGAMASTPAISLGNDAPATLINVSLERFDRLQRMIRLQRWLGLPFAQLDTLLVSAMRCEGASNRALLITHNTLRALGVFCYLNRRYTLQAEEFAAWLHQMPVHASGKRVSLFDQVFNRAGSALPPLYLDGKAFDATTAQQLCAGLGLQDTQDSLQLLIADRPATRTIETVSALYRQARIARLFGLSVMECRQLAQLLGKANVLTQLRTPTLRRKPKGATDFLDVLMHLEWASRWLKENGNSLPLFRHQLLLDKQVRDPAINLLLKEFAAYDQASLSTKLNLLELPQQPSDEDSRLPAVDWNALASQVLQRARSSTSVEVALDAQLSSVAISTNPTRTTFIIEQTKQKLLTLVSTVRDELWALYLRLKKIIQSVPHLPGNANGHQKYDHYGHFLRLYAPAAPPLQTLGYLILLLPHAVDVLQWPLSRQALDQFLINPHWLDSDYQASSLLELTPHTLYLMQQFNHCIDRFGLTEGQILDYFRQANTPPGSAAQNTSDETNERLARLCGWSASEIGVFSSQLKPPRITSMDRLDWLLRCRQASTATGLPATLLIAASQLKTDATFAQWKAVGEALTSAHASPVNPPSPADLFKD